MGNLIINRLDYTRIKECIIDAKRNKSINDIEAKELVVELNSAKIVEPQDVPSNIVTMNSIVKLSFLDSKKQVQFTIVYPDEASMKEYRISIFSPIATALIGYKVGDVVEWLIPSGLTQLRIDEIVYQPEAAGNFDL
ncbi:nucleoside diphosphate kinase regulator [Ancylomarina sp. 16SWW S1-10-2]|uniref:nucleoside diphosphate kinase regulator n=1 Tax=Ancylomarina sp. 16SWW S1-10-2 TaxID=2499681 RepID=UPI0012AEA5EA|nr:nucleoside diphosphate kinase regulator [Ancylomarina sp. 16SWW S1-10-2]MRT93726.1 nucleoside diphosphate kinase regulator [Ancylomarina sp. 16SWW S1-10-2]